MAELVILLRHSTTFRANCQDYSLQIALFALSNNLRFVDDPYDDERQKC